MTRHQIRAPASRGSSQVIIGQEEQQQQCKGEVGLPKRTREGGPRLCDRRIAMLRKEALRCEGATGAPIRNWGALHVLEQEGSTAGSTSESSKRCGGRGLG